MDDLAHFIYEQILEHSGASLRFEVRAVSGTEPLRPGLRRTGGSPLAYYTHSVAEEGVWLEFGGFARCLYPVQVLGGADLGVVRTLERESVCWFRPVRGQFAIYKSDASEEQYQPDFVAEFAQSTYLIDLIHPETPPDPPRQAALREWCRHASSGDSKPWRYVRLSTVDLLYGLRQLT